MEGLSKLLSSKLMSTKIFSIHINISYFCD